MHTHYSLTIASPNCRVLEVTCHCATRGGSPLRHDGHPGPATLVRGTGGARYKLPVGVGAVRHLRACRLRTRRKHPRRVLRTVRPRHAGGPATLTSCSRPFVSHRAVLCVHDRHMSYTYYVYSTRSAYRVMPD